MKMVALAASLLVFVTCVTGVLSACIPHPIHASSDAAPPESSMRLLQATQIIIKFRDPGLDPSQSHFLNEISRDAGATLIYIRPMSGGAHVLRPENPTDGAELNRIVERLRTRPDVEYVEPDRPMHYM